MCFQGFWDLISIAITEIETRFANLATLEANNWIEPQKSRPKIVKKPAGGANRAKPSFAASAKPSAAKPSGLKAIIEAKRRAKAEADAAAAAAASEGPSTSVQATVSITVGGDSGEFLNYFLKQT